MGVQQVISRKIALLSLFVLALLCPLAHGQMPAPRVSYVVITAPKAVEGAYRTAKTVLELNYTSDATFGPFIVTSQGGNRSYAATVPAEGTGVVDVGFHQEGKHEVYVTVVSTRTVNGVTAAAGSPRLNVIFDRTGPRLEAAGAVSEGKVFLYGSIKDDHARPGQLDVIVSMNGERYRAQANDDGDWVLTVDLSDIGGSIDGVEFIARERLDDGAIQEGERVWLSVEELQP